MLRVTFGWALESVFLGCQNLGPSVCEQILISLKLLLLFLQAFCSGYKPALEALLLDGILTLQKKDTSMKFWAERIFFCHTYDTSMTIIVSKLGIIIVWWAPTSMTKNHDQKWAFRPGRAGDATA